jgi:hypothetical protein
MSDETRDSSASRGSPNAIENVMVEKADSTMRNTSKRLPSERQDFHCHDPEPLVETEEEGTQGCNTYLLDQEEGDVAKLYSQKEMDSDYSEGTAYSLSRKKTTGTSLHLNTNISSDLLVSNQLFGKVCSVMNQCDSRNQEITFSQKDYVDLYSTFKLGTGVERDQLLARLLPVHLISFENLPKMDKINSSIVDAKLFERLVVSRMLVDFDCTFYGQSQPGHDATGNFSSVLFTTPSTRVFELINQRLKTRAKRVPAITDVRARPLIFLFHCFLDLIFPNTFTPESIGKAFALSLGGFRCKKGRKDQVTSGEKMKQSVYLLAANDRLPPTNVLLWRLMVACRAAFSCGSKRNRRVSFRPHHATAWRYVSLPLDQFEWQTYTTNRRRKLDNQEGKSKKEKAISSTWPGYPLYGIPESETQPSFSPGDFMSLDDYCSEEVITEIENRLRALFTGGCSLLSPPDRNTDVKVNVVKYRQPGTNRFSMVFSAQSVFSESRITKHFSDMDKASFLQSSQEVGNNVRRVRMFRCSLYPSDDKTGTDDEKYEAIRGVFTLASDKTPLGCVTMCPPEIFMADFCHKIVSVMDNVISLFCRGKLHARCVKKDILCQSLIAGMRDSGYGEHDDGGPELKHDHDDYEGVEGEDREELLRHLPLKLVWVMTVSVSNSGFGTKPGAHPTSLLHLFSKTTNPPWKNTTDIITNWSSFHLQCFGNQHDLRHAAVSNAPEYSYEENCTGHGRHVLSFRRAVDFRPEHLPILKKRLDEKGYSLVDTRSDYNVIGVVSHIFDNQPLVALSRPAVPEENKGNMDDDNNGEARKVDLDKDDSDVLTPTQIMKRLGMLEMVLKKQTQSIVSGVDGTESVLENGENITARDPVPLWERLASSSFFSYFQKTKIELILSFKQQLAKNNYRTHYARFGRQPKLQICTNYQDCKKKGWVPLYKERSLRDGDIVETVSARRIFDLPATPKTQPPWKHIHSSVCSVMFLSKRYKSSYLMLDGIQAKLDKFQQKQQTTDEKQGDMNSLIKEFKSDQDAHHFICNECGGAAQHIGSTSRPIAKCSMSQRDSALQLPAPQAAKSPANMVMYEVQERAGYMLCFRPPLVVPTLPNRKDDFQQFLGVFSVDEIKAVGGSKKRFGERMGDIRKEDKLLCSFLLAPHKEIHLRRIAIWSRTPIKMQAEEKRTPKGLEATEGSKPCGTLVEDTVTKEVRQTMEEIQGEKGEEDSIEGSYNEKLGTNNNEADVVTNRINSKMPKNMAADSTEVLNTKSSGRNSDSDGDGSTVICGQPVNSTVPDQNKLRGTVECNHDSKVVGQTMRDVIEEEDIDDLDVRDHVRADSHKKLRLDDGAAGQFTEHSVMGNDGDDWRIIQMDVSDAVANYHMRIPFNKEKNGMDDIEAVAQAYDPDNIIQYFHDNLVNDLVGEQDETMDTGNLGLANRADISVTKETAISLLKRQFVAGSCRFLRTDHLHYDVQKKKTTAGFLDSQPFHASLGKVQQSRPSPLPIRSYDVSTLFVLNQAQASYQKTENGRTRDDKAKEYTIERRCLVHCTEEMVHDFVLSSAAMRTTGKVEKIKTYLEHKDTSFGDEGNAGFYALLTSTDASGLPAYMALLHSGDAAIDKKCVMSDWMSPQFSSKIPETCKRSPRYLSRFLKKFCVAIKRHITPICKRVNPQRNAVLAAMIKCIKQACVGSECADGIRFVAGQIVSDMEEMFSGKTLDETPFVCGEGMEIVTGYGSREGFSIYHLGNEKKAGGIRKRKRGDYFIDVYDQEDLHLVSREFLTYMEKELNEDDLIQMGLERMNIGVGANKKSVVVVRLSGRRIAAVDVEHMMCKIYLAVASYRGSRAFSLPNPCRPHCHPTPSEDIFDKPSLKKIFQEARDSFKNAFKRKTLDCLQEPFLYKSEKHGVER